ncbi:MAG: hypothetical protein AAF602_11850 [Myxococcota bacterium]
MSWIEDLQTFLLDLVPLQPLLGPASVVFAATAMAAMGLLWLAA